MNSTRWTQTNLARRLALAAAAGAFGSAQAQTAPTDPPPPAAAASAPAAAPAVEGGGLRLGTVVVTTQRRRENIQDVGVSVTGVAGDKLAERNITDLGQMEQVVPGFTFGRSGTDARPAMRGVRTENVSVTGDTTIGYFVDGIYKSRAQQGVASFVDLDVVEVQRGPQGTLYGRNTFGGNVSITTVAPKLGKTEGSVGLGIARFSRLRSDAAVNLPLGDSAALRFAGAYDHGDGYVRNDYDADADLFDTNSKYGRLAVRFKPDNQLDIVVRFDATRQNTNGGSAFGYKLAGTYLDVASCQQLFNASPYVLNTRAGNRDGVNDCTRTQSVGGGAAAGTSVDLGIPIYRPGDGYRIDQDYHTFQSLRDQSASIDASYRFPWFTLKSITGYADFRVKRTSDSDFSSSTIAIDYQNTEAKTFSQELQLLSEGKGPLQWIGGYYYFRDELRGTFSNQQLPRTIRSSALAAPLSLAQNGSGSFDDPTPLTESNALYGQVSYNVVEPLQLTAGARYTRDRKTFAFANANALLPTAVSTAGANIGVAQPDTRLISVDTPQAPESAFGGGGSGTNCTSPTTSSYNGGAVTVGPGYNCGGPNNSVLYGARYDTQTFSKWTGRLAADYRLSDRNLLYTSVATGFRSGGFNSGQAIGSVRSFKPEEVKAWEIGSKNRLLDGDMVLNLAAFWNDYKNLQEQRQVPVGNTTVSTIFNAAKARARGLELETEWLATDALSVGGTLSLLDAKYTSFPDVALPFGTSILVADASQAAPTVVDGVTIAPAGQRRVFAPGYDCRLVPGTGGTGQPGAAFGCDLSGKRVPYSPKVQGSLFTGYEFNVGLGRMQPVVVVTFTSAFYGQPTNAGLERQSGFAKVDLRFNWDATAQLATQMYVENATDRQTVQRFVWGGGGALQYSVAPPRTWGLKATYKF